MPGVYSSQNPFYAGNSSTFYANIKWIGNTGTVTWAVNGHNITGDTYAFPSAGNYAVTATAINSYCSNSTSFTEKVLSTASQNGAPLKGISRLRMAYRTTFPFMKL